MTRLLVAHGTNLLERGFMTSSTDRKTPDGDPSGALFVATSALRRALAFKEPDIAVAVLDAEASEKKWPPLLEAQLPRLAELFESHGLNVVYAGSPADVVASYTQAALDDGGDVVIIGSDKRLAQLVSDSVWWYDAYKDVRYTPELVRKRFEVLPDKVSEWLAVVGDDGVLPGVKGLGKKGATTIIEEFGSITAAIADLDSVKGRPGKALRASVEDAEREIKRALLDRKCALPAPLAELDYRSPDAASVRDYYSRHGFFELLEAEEMSPLDVQVCKTPEMLAAFAGELGPAPVSVHPLFDGPSAIRGVLVGLALAQRETIAYVPMNGDGMTAALREFFAKREVIGHDTKAFVAALARRGIEAVAIVGDSVCASHLAEPSNWAPHDLPLVARHVLRIAIPETDSVLGVGKRRKTWAKLDVDKAAEFAARYADTSAKVWTALEPTTDKTLLTEYLELSDTLVRMERNGIGVDAADLANAGSDFERIGAEIEKDIFDIAGKEFNLGSTKQLGSVLFEDLELPILKRTKTGWSTANEALERIEHAHPIVSLVIRWRRLRRLRDSWVTALGKAIDDDGRVRSTFHPARSFSGRLVNSHPDLGRVPGRTPEMSRIRHAFCAPEGKTILSVDYSQLGLFVLAHLTEDPALAEPLANQDDIHTLTAAAVLELAADEIDKDKRQLGKIINFATFAGQGASALSLQLGVTAKEAKEFIARFNKRYSVVRAFQDEQLELAKDRGYITTIAGRRWPIGSLSSLDHMEKSYAERLARRATHEGSVADVSRRGLLRADQALRAANLSAFPLLQVHDEVLFEVPTAELADAAAVASEAMKNAFELHVPLRVGCKAGPNWADLEPL